MRRLALCLALALVIGACGAAGQTAATTVPSASSTTGDSTLDATTTLRPSTTTTTLPPPTTTTTTSRPTTSALPAFPPGRESLVHGGDAWVVVLAGAETADDAALSDATQAAADAGYQTGPTDCDFGAEEALGQPDGTITVSVYLESEADAQAALLAFEARGVSGVVAQVQTFCLD